MSKSILNFIILILILSSCADRKRTLKCNETIEYIVSTDYDWFEDHESYYYELISDSRTKLINKKWFWAREKNGIKLSIFSCVNVDSMVLLMMHDNYILSAYNLNESYELSFEELQRLQPE